jgi:hypothetical protein
MARIHIVTEGATEENFVNDVLSPYLSHKGIYVDAHSITTRRDRRRNRIYRGGLANLDHLLKDVKIWLAQEQQNADCWVTTMVDLYAFPYQDKEYWIEGFESKGTGLEKAIFLEQQLHLEFQNSNRLIPYIQLYEFESLLLVDVNVIHRAFSDHYHANTLQLLKNNIGELTPEEVNQGAHSAPSKRIIQHYPEYEDSKPVWGSLIAQEIGIEKMRANCPHFNEWLIKLETLE